MAGIQSMQILAESQPAGKVSHTALPELAIGSLTDGVGFVSSMVHDDHVLNYGLVLLGALLRAIGGRANE